MFGSNYSKYNFGDRILKRRKECGFRAQVDLAEKMVPACEDAGENERNIESKRKAISNWESGKSYPPLQDFTWLCEVLDCDPQYLLGDIDVPRKETKSVMEITGLSEGAVKKIQRINEESEYIDILSALIEDSNFEYLMYLFCKRFEYSLYPVVTPIIKTENGKTHLKNAKDFYSSVRKNEVNISLDNSNLIAKKSNLLDSLISSAIIDRMQTVAMAHRKIRESKING